MLIGVEDLSRHWGLRPTTILHVGAHEAEEAEAYEAFGWGEGGVVWVEADPVTTERLRKRLAVKFRSHETICALAWDTSGERLSFLRTSNGQSSSALPLKDHLSVYPTVVVDESIEVETARLDDLLASDPRDFEFINLDIQGAELRALIGLGTRLDSAQAVYSEVSRRELYEGSPSFTELDSWLEERGFHLVEVRWVPQGWGDALWLRSEGRARPRESWPNRFVRLGQNRWRYAVMWFRWRATTVRDSLRIR